MTAALASLNFPGSDPEQRDALRSMLTDDGPAEPRVKDLPPDPARESATLRDLSAKLGMPVDDLYNRARGRGLLIAVTSRTAAADRTVYTDQLAAVLAPPRQVTRRVPSAEVAKVSADVSKEAAAKVSKLWKKGYFTADEAMFLIEAALNGVAVFGSSMTSTE